MMNIAPIPAFTDNYIWMIQSENNNQVFVVDPGDAMVVEHTLKANKLELAGILVTHHHHDHTGGIKQLIQNRNIPVYSPENKAISFVTQPVKEGDRVNILGTSFEVLTTPGHTLDHIVYFTSELKIPALFCGDTLFAGGCGRLFEGSAEQMHESLTKLGLLPKKTRVYCAHEYTLANLNFALAVEPHNQKLHQQISRCSDLRQQNLPTLPSSIGVELNTNPFMRCDQSTVIAAAKHRSSDEIPNASSVLRVIRAWKDEF